MYFQFYNFEIIYKKGKENIFLQYSSHHDEPQTFKSISINQLDWIQENLIDYIVNTPIDQLQWDNIDEKRDNPRL